MLTFSHRNTYPINNDSDAFKFLVFTKLEALLIIIIIMPYNCTAYS